MGDVSIRANATSHLQVARHLLPDRLYQVTVDAASFAGAVQVDHMKILRPCPAHAFDRVRRVLAIDGDLREIAFQEPHRLAADEVHGEKNFHFKSSWRYLIPFSMPSSAS